jgi:hypothetical protein
MSEIDFDELDRAVNGALGKTPSQPFAPAQPVPDSIQTQVEPPVIEQRERVQLSPVDKTPASISAPAARRSSGRFMDMVHPSSDMRSNVTTKPTVQSIPSSPAQAPQVEQTVPEAPAWNEPLESPFLPDAKVEKRPLGGIAEEAPEPASFDFQGLLDESDEELLEAPEPQERIEAHAMPDPIDFAAASTVSDEIEARTYEEEQDDHPDSTPEEAQSSESEPVVEVFKPAEEISQHVKTIEEEPIGPTSITPQYKEQASSNQESGSIYDTESYHQPVVVPSKKRSGLTTLIWIIVLILLGAAAGWAVYVFVLPSVI